MLLLNNIKEFANELLYSVQVFFIKISKACDTLHNRIAYMKKRNLKPFLIINLADISWNCERRNVRMTANLKKPVKMEMPRIRNISLTKLQWPIEKSVWLSSCITRGSLSKQKQLFWVPLTAHPLSGLHETTRKAHWRTKPDILWLLSHFILIVWPLVFRSIHLGINSSGQVFGLQANCNNKRSKTAIWTILPGQTSFTVKVLLESARSTATHCTVQRTQATFFWGHRILETIPASTQRNNKLV